MSHTDKTRPHSVKLDEMERENPYGIKREAFVMWREGLHGCKDSCWMCSGWREDENRRQRREGRRMVRDWQDEY